MLPACAHCLAQDSSWPPCGPLAASPLCLLCQAVNNNPVVLFMKGTPQNPQCGFSQQVVRVLQSHSVSFGSVNVLANEHIRQGIKEFR